MYSLYPFRFTSIFPSINFSLDKLNEREPQSDTSFGESLNFNCVLNSKKVRGTIFIKSTMYLNILKNMVELIKIVACTIKINSTKYLYKKRYHLN